MIVIATSLLLAGQVAWADPADDAYEEGRRLYDLREWDQAILKFKEAYRIRPDAKSLFNVAQAYRLKGDCIEAINFYRTYKRNFPKEKNLAKANKFITELEPCAKKQATKPEPVQPEPVQPEPEPVQPDPVPSPAVPAPVSQPPRLPPAPVDSPNTVGQGQRRAGVTIAIIGSVVFIGGAYFGLEARSLAVDAESGAGGAAWDPTIQEDGKAADFRAKLLLGIGGAAILGGALLYKAAPTANASRLGVVPSPDGAMLVWMGKL